MNSNEPATCTACPRTLATVERGLDHLGRCLDCANADYAHLPRLSWDAVLATLSA